MFSLDSNASSLIKSYLTNGYQRCKIRDAFSEWERIIAGVPQRTIIGTVFFNIFINNVFLYIENSFYASGESSSMI